jgi:hypothetical protein
MLEARQPRIGLYPNRKGRAGSHPAAHGLHFRDSHSAIGSDHIGSAFGQIPRRLARFHAHHGMALFRTGSKRHAGNRRQSGRMDGLKGEPRLREISHRFDDEPVGASLSRGLGLFLEHPQDFLRGDFSHHQNDPCRADRGKNLRVRSRGPL